MTFLLFIMRWAATLTFVNGAILVPFIIVLAVVAQRMIQNRVLSDPEVDSRPLTSNAKTLAVMSLVCWLGAITAGRLLAYVGSSNGL